MTQLSAWPSTSAMDVFAASLSQELTALGRLVPAGLEALVVEQTSTFTKQENMKLPAANYYVGSWGTCITAFTIGESTVYCGQGTQDRDVTCLQGASLGCVALVRPSESQDCDSNIACPEPEDAFYIEVLKYGAYAFGSSLVLGLACCCCVCTVLNCRRPKGGTLNHHGDEDGIKFKAHWQVILPEESKDTLKDDQQSERSASTAADSSWTIIDKDDRVRVVWDIDKDSVYMQMLASQEQPHLEFIEDSVSIEMEHADHILGSLDGYWNTGCGTLVVIVAGFIRGEKHGKKKKMAFTRTHNGGIRISPGGKIFEARFEGGLLWWSGGDIWRRQVMGETEIEENAAVEDFLDFKVFSEEIVGRLSFDNQVVQGALVKFFQESEGMLHPNHSVRSQFAPFELRNEEPDTFTHITVDVVLHRRHGPDGNFQASWKHRRCVLRPVTEAEIQDRQPDDDGIPIPPASMSTKMQVMPTELPQIQDGEPPGEDLELQALGPAVAGQAVGRLILSVRSAAAYSNLDQATEAVPANISRITTDSALLQKTQAEYVSRVVMDKAMKPFAEHGDAVEYWSSSNSIWVYGTVVLGLDTLQILNDLLPSGEDEYFEEFDIVYNVRIGRGNLRQRVALDSIRPIFKEGENVEVFTQRDQGRWVRGEIHGPQLSATRFGYTIRVQEDPFMLEKVPGLRIRRSFPAGLPVEVYRGQYIGWVPTVVHGIAEEDPPAQQALETPPPLDPRMSPSGVVQHRKQDTQTVKPWTYVPVVAAEARGEGAQTVDGEVLPEWLPSYFVRCCATAPNSAGQEVYEFNTLV